MNKINYPTNSVDFKNFKKEYQKLILESRKIDILEIQNFFKLIGITDSFEDILILPLDSLIKLRPLSETNIFTGLTEIEKKDKKKQIKSYFKYDSFQQNELSKFFNTYSDSLNVIGCCYCGIDFINSYIPFNNDYRDFEHFMTECAEGDLLKIKNIGPDRAEKILNNYKGVITKKSEISNGKYKVINDILHQLTDDSGALKTHKFIENKKNHFTLDHVLPQSEFPHLSLSIFNLVPSCYSCNSKLKKDKKIYSDIEELRYTSPTSTERIDDVIFKIYFRTGFNVKRLPINLNDYSIKIESTSPEYFNVLNLQGRYNFHKNVSYKLISKRRIYSDSQIKEILKLFGNNGINIPESELKKQIFGYEIFEDYSNIPFQKYKKDLARQLKIL